MKEYLDSIYPLKYFYLKETRKGSSLQENKSSIYKLSSAPKDSASL